jgi:hypothetical protein
LEGLSPCFSASTAMAGLIKQVRNKSFPVKETVLVNLTGGERTGEPAPKKIIWMQRGQNGWTEEKIASPAPDFGQSNGRVLVEQQGVAYAKTVAEAMNLKVDADNPADREKLRRAVLDLVAGRKMRKQKGHG